MKAGVLIEREERESKKQGLEGGRIYVGIWEDIRRDLGHKGV
jgi:hypothetical protein